MATRAVPAMSVAEFLALPEDGLTHELIRGEHIVTPAPVSRHELIHSALFVALHELLRPHPSFVLMGHQPEIHIGSDSVLEPDLVIMPRFADMDETSWREFPTPLLVVEILSPGTARRDCGVKRELYLDGGVGEYWIVDGVRKEVERWPSGATAASVHREEIVLALQGRTLGKIDLRTIWMRK